MRTTASDKAELPVWADQTKSPFETGAVIGKGQSNVSQAWRRSKSKDAVGRELYAQKTIDFDGEESDVKSFSDARKEFLQEVKILREAQHKHVIKFIDAFALQDTTPPRLALVMEQATENLSNYLRAPKKPEQQWYGCLVAAVDYIHGLGIRHRDIKPANILLKNKKVALADFGISRMGIGITLSTTVPSFASGRDKTFCAPEVEYGASRGRSADIFSLGAVFLKMVVADLELQGDLAGALKGSRGMGPSFALKLDKVHEFMCSLQAQGRLDDWQKGVVSLCQSMLQKSRHKRPDSAKVREKVRMLPKCGCTCEESATPTLNMRLVEACKEGSLREVKKLIESGASPSAIGAIHQASAHGHKDIVEALLAANADVNVRDYSDQTALHCAAGYERVEIVEVLCGHGVDCMFQDVEGRTALHYAAGVGHRGFVEKLMRRGEGKALSACLDQDKQTALHFAAKRGHESVVEILLLTSCAQASDKDGRTPLHFASGYGSPKVVDLLIKNSADVNAQDKNDMTPLHFAAVGKRSKGHLEVVQKLLEAKANVELQDIDGRTARGKLDKGDPLCKILSEAMLAAEQSKLLQDDEKAIPGKTKKLVTRNRAISGKTKRLVARNRAVPGKTERLVTRSRNNPRQDRKVGD